MELENFPDKSPTRLSETPLRTPRPLSLATSGISRFPRTTSEDFLVSREETVSLTEPVPTGGVTDQDEDNSQPLKSSLGDRPSAWLWWIEALCCFSSIGAMVAIAAILRAYDRRPLPDWPRQITINSLVSIFVILLKTPMLLVIAEGVSQMKWLWFQTSRPLSNLAVFESASRGAYGSVKLLYLLRLKHLAAIGAAVMLFAVAIGPFTQQSVQYYSCLQLSSNMTSSIRRSQDYMPFEELLMVNLPMKSAILEGMLASTKNVSFDCPTGNCNFSTPYTSVGVCHTCRNAVYDLYKNCETSAGQDRCSLSLKNGLNVSTHEDVTNDTASYVPMMSASQVANPNESFTPDAGLGFANFSMIALTRDECTTEWITDDSLKKPETDCAPAAWTEGNFNVTAVECVLSYCVNTYEASVENGIMSERILSTSGTALQNGRYDSFPGLINYTGVGTWWENFYALLANPCYIEGLPQSIHNVTPATPQYNSSFPDDFDYGWAIIDDKNVTIPRECVYTVIADRALEGLLNFHLGLDAFRAIFDGSAVSFMNQDSIWVDFDPVWLEPLFNDWYSSYAIVDAIFATLAHSMTTQMRQMQNASSPAVGDVYVNQTCVRVSWLWLSLPVALVLLSCIFLALVVSQTAKAGVPPWKSEPLPLLFVGLGDGLREKLHARFRVTDMMEVAAARVILLRLRDRWRFTESTTTEGYQAIATQP